METTMDETASIQLDQLRAAGAQALTERRAEAARKEAAELTRIAHAKAETDAVRARNARAMERTVLAKFGVEVTITDITATPYGTWHGSLEVAGVTVHFDQKHFGDALVGDLRWEETDDYCEAFRPYGDVLEDAADLLAFVERTQAEPVAPAARKRLFRSL